jgi:hypothetical protein
LAGGEGFEPSTPNLGAPKQAYFSEKDVNWAGFRQFLKDQKYRGGHDSYLFNLALSYHHCLLDVDYSEIAKIQKSQVKNVLCALAALSKFLGCYSRHKQLLKDYGLKWKGRSSDDIIIDRLSRSDDPNDVFQWICDVKEACPDYSVFMDFIAITGLRLTEAINSFNLIISLTKEGSLTQKYFNVDFGFLEHFRFKETFIRSCKKAFVSYVPLEMLELIGKQKSVSFNHFKNKELEKKHIPQRFSDVRENQASFVTRWLTPAEIDLIHGRATKSVFMANYFNPKLVADLKNRASQAAQPILVKVNSELILKENAGGEKID